MPKQHSQGGRYAGRYRQGHLRRLNEAQGHLRAQRRPPCERRYHLRGTGHRPAREVSVICQSKKYPPRFFGVGIFCARRFCLT